MQDITQSCCLVFSLCCKDKKKTFYWGKFKASTIVEWLCSVCVCDFFSFIHSWMIWWTSKKSSINYSAKCCEKSNSMNLFVHFGAQLKSQRTKQNEFPTLFFIHMINQLKKSKCPNIYNAFTHTHRKTCVYVKIAR